jgi:hypothetical protein
MENGFPGNVEDIDDNRVIEVDIIFEAEFEASGGLSVSLAVDTVFSEVCQGLPINVVFCTF